jgi:hypothetical protein
MIGGYWAVNLKVGNYWEVQHVTDLQDARDYIAEWKAENPTAIMELRIANEDGKLLFPGSNQR